MAGEPPARAWYLQIFQRLHIQWRVGGKQNAWSWCVYHANGDVYDGEWQSDKRHGHGMYTYKSGSVYVGQWKDGVEHGEGSVKYKRGGEVVKGVWVEGVLRK